MGTPNPHYKGLSIKQKIPLWIYVWARSHQKKWVVIMNRIYYYDIYNQCFDSKSVMEYIPYGHDLQQLINTFLKKYPLISGYELSFFCELPRTIGVGFDQLLIANVVCILYRLAGLIDAQTIAKWRDISINELLHNESFVSSSLYRTISLWQNTLLWSIQQDDYTANSLFYNPYPTITFHNEKQRDGSYKLYAYRLNNLVSWLSHHPHSPLDFMLIYSGKPIVLEQNTWHLQTNEKYKNKLIDLYKTRFEHDISHELPLDRPLFYKHFIETNNKYWWLLDYMISMASISTELLYSTYKIYKKGYDEEDIKDFVATINKSRYASMINKKSSHAFQELVAFVYNVFGIQAHKVGFTFNDTNISWGCLLLVAPYEWFRMSFKKIDQEIRNDDRPFRVIYSNWTDGIEYDWLLIEQDMEHGIYSEYIHKKTYKIVSSQWQECIDSYDALATNVWFDILCNTVTMKITLRGHSLSSKELHSQSATIEVLRYLLHHQWEVISSKDLPPSSYTKVKNDMQGKIIGPLQAALMKYLGKKLNLTLTGSWSIFFLTLDQPWLTIGFLDEVISRT